MLLMSVVQSCWHSGATYHICCMPAETISVISSEYMYQHSAPDLALNLCTCCVYIGGSSAQRYCGATYNTSLCAVTTDQILIFFSETTRYKSLFIGHASLKTSSFKFTVK